MGEQTAMFLKGEITSSAKVYLKLRTERASPILQEAKCQSVEAPHVLPYSEIRSYKFEHGQLFIFKMGLPGTRGADFTT